MLHPLADRLADQSGVGRREQLYSAGLTEAEVRAEIDGRRWHAVNDVVVVTHNGPLTQEQQQWAVVLSCREPVGLGGLTAIANHGVKGFDTDTVHVVVTKGARPLDVPGVAIHVHESRRFTSDDLIQRLPPMTSLERSTIDAAVWSKDIRTAFRICVAPVQQRLTTATRLRRELLAAGAVHFRRPLLLFLADLEGGAEALSEVVFLRWCRRHRLPKPETSVRYDRNGRRRYLDATFRLPDGSALFVEIDGGIHLLLMVRWEDTIKDNDAVLANRKTLRFASAAIYADDPRALRQLREALGMLSEPHVA
ncbi:MAG: hypothetical protein JO246_03215 [Frankiaceae bacterium]|nr:hypothetical protein [Frankiaceae bacterium]MBV9871814.1 hypothetical protein [Frankiaceae bacterium]